jgi:hypothetical protein
MKTKLPVTAVLALSAALLAGCSKSETAGARGEAHIHAGHSHHEHKPPHGGTPIELGEEEYHLEFVRDAEAGKLQAYILDGHLEFFVRIAAPSFAIAAQVGGKEETLTFQPVASSATGEAVGNTSLFEAKADWLKSATNFEAVLKEITIRTRTYTNVSFNFPKGRDEGAQN